MSIALIHFAARAGDHNDRAMHASQLLADVLGDRLGRSAEKIGEATPSQPSGWRDELTRAMPAFRQLSARFERVLANQDVPVTALSRCAVALATLPIVAKHRPDAVVVWFDAHADLNTPTNTQTGYLGGLALSGPLGFWVSGLGMGLNPANAVLVGTRDFDAAEHQIVRRGVVGHVDVGDTMADELRRVIDGRPVYVHIDCDVLDPGIVPTDYSVPDGMTLAQLTACARVLAEEEVIGLEIGELEADEQCIDPHDPARRIVDALEPLIDAVLVKPKIARAN
jgi:arginase family enzyme